MYLGITTTLLGMAVFFSSIAMLIAPAVFYAVIDRMVIPREEETMERLFSRTTPTTRIGSDVGSKTLITGGCAGARAAAERRTKMLSRLFKLFGGRQPLD